VPSESLYAQAVMMAIESERVGAMIMTRAQRRRKEKDDNKTEKAGKEENMEIHDQTSWLSKYQRV